MIRRLPDLWGRQEAPRSLALIRIGVALVILFDHLQMAWAGLPPFFFSLPPDGIGAGIWLDPVLPEGPARGWTLWALVVVSALLFGAGVATRLSGLLLLLCYAQTAATFGWGDRAIDRMLRNALLILLFSRCGASLSLDARLRTGRWRGDNTPIPAWPRHLLAFQLVVLYLSAGLHKIGAAWSSADGYSALYYVLQRPDVSRFDLDWHGLYPITQLATAFSIYWEYLAPVVLLAFWYRHTASRPGRLRRLFNRLHPERWWILAGVGFHLGIAIFLHLGIFAWGMLALYPAFIHPDRWPRAQPIPAAPKRAHPAKAAAITAAALIISVHALPWPTRLDQARIERPRVQEQIQPWMPTARALGLGDTPEEFWSFLVRWSVRLNAGQAIVEAPFKPLLDLTGTGQRWQLFMVPGPTRYRLAFEIETDGGQRRTINATRDSAHDWGDAFIRYRRTRPPLFRKAKGRPPTHGPVSEWIAHRILAAHPEATRVHFVVQRSKSAKPPAPPDSTWRPIHRKTYPRPVVDSRPTPR